MALGSRLKAAETRLVEIIAARPALAGVQVERGHPAKLIKRESIWIDQIQFSERTASLGGSSNRRDQDINVAIIIRVNRQGNDVGALKDRAYDVADEVEEALRADPGLDGAVEFGGVVIGEAESFTDSDGWIGAVRLGATYRARKG